MAEGEVPEAEADLREGEDEQDGVDVETPDGAGRREDEEGLDELDDADQSGAEAVGDERDAVARPGAHPHG